MKVNKKHSKAIIIEFILVESFETISTKATAVQTPITPSSSINIECSDNTITKKEDKSVLNTSSTTNFTPPIIHLLMNNRKFKKKKKQQNQNLIEMQLEKKKK